MTALSALTLPQVFQVGSGRGVTSRSSAWTFTDDVPRAKRQGLQSGTGRGRPVILIRPGAACWSFVAERVSQHGTELHKPRLRISGDVRPRESPRDGRWGPADEYCRGDRPQSALDQPRAVGSMAFARRQLNATLLPDGTVLVTGGTSSSGFNNPAGAVHAAELWNPTTEQWTTLASSSGIPRVYHSCALLLPDGRVLSMGGNGQRKPRFTHRRTQGTRPTITSAPKASPTDSPSSSKRQTPQQFQRSRC